MSHMTPATVALPLASTAVMQLAVGPAAQHVCAQAESFEVFCWGANGAGQLGPSGTVAFNSGVPLAVAWP